MPDKLVTPQTVEQRGELYAANEIERVRRATAGQVWSRQEVLDYFKDVIQSAFRVGAAAGMDEQTRSMNERYTMRPRGQKGDR